MPPSGTLTQATEISDKMTPQSSKSTTDKVGEAVGNVGDRAQRDLVPDSQKSTTQSMSDKAGREKDSATGETTMVSLCCHSSTDTERALTALPLGQGQAHSWHGQELGGDFTRQFRQYGLYRMAWA